MKQETTTTRVCRGVSYSRYFGTTALALLFGTAIGVLMGVSRNKLTIDVRDVASASSGKSRRLSGTSKESK